MRARYRWINLQIVHNTLQLLALMGVRLLGVGGGGGELHEKAKRSVVLKRLMLST